MCKLQFSKCDPNFGIIIEHLKSLYSETPEFSWPIRPNQTRKNIKILDTLAGIINKFPKNKNRTLN
jgi:hypothetical protein